MLILSGRRLGNEKVDPRGLCDCIGDYHSSGRIRRLRTESAALHIPKVIDVLYRDRKLGGYDPGRRFTQDLSYGPSCCVKASRPVPQKRPDPTMHVAAAAETMIQVCTFTGKPPVIFLSSALIASHYLGSTDRHEPH